jgi:hypothetical protein
LLVAALVHASFSLGGLLPMPQVLTTAAIQK